ncbi:hypothetical protein BSKO_08981 [Bryopsis sp. KO-2023]|nr:hypothetical protein BSKO_08981 [Bryopsis sp. KO-2023]
MNAETAAMMTTDCQVRAARNPHAGVKVFRLLKHVILRRGPRTPRYENHSKHSPATGGGRWFPRGLGQTPLTVKAPRPPTNWVGIRGFWRNITSKRPLERPSGQNNILPLVHEEQQRQDLDVDLVLDRVCVLKSDFAFEVLEKWLNADGSIGIEGWSTLGDLDWCDGNLSMGQIGRQLGMLGLIAISEVDPESATNFYVGSSAVVDDYDGCTDSDPIFRGVARLSKVDCAQAKAELEFWQNKRLLCRMSMTYNVISSWEEVLPKS